MPDVICLGEALIDFVSDTVGVSVMDAPGFRKAPGGAPANVSVGLAKLGVSSAFIGKVGDDPFGRFLERTLSSQGVDTSHMSFDREARTGLAFVSLTEDLQPDFVFFRNPSADMRLAPDEIDEKFIASGRVFHFGSVTLISEPSHSATLWAVEVARDNGLLISYDPNLRLPLWPDAEAAREGMLEAMPFAHWAKVSEVELEFLTGTSDLSEGTRRLREMGPSLVAVTLGRDGCFAANGEAEVSCPGFSVESADTTGAGDGFVAGALQRLLRLEGAESLGCLEPGYLREVFTFANAVGALTTTVKGVIPALPDLESVRAFLTGQIHHRKDAKNAKNS